MSVLYGVCQTGINCFFGPETMRNLVCLWRLSWIGMVSALTPAWAADVGPRPLVRLAVSEWPPFTGEHLPGNGIGADTLRQMLGRAGYQLELVWLPWTRAVRDGSGMDSKLDGYFPEYTTADTRRRCQLSAPIGMSVLGLAHQAAQPVNWTHMADLARYRVGVVNGYVNTDAFDAAVSAGILRVDGASSDESNLRKLLRERIDVAVIDREVMGYLLAEPALRNQAGQLAFHSHWLGELPLRVCFRHGARLQPILAAMQAHRLPAAQLRAGQGDYLRQLAEQR